MVLAAPVLIAALLMVGARPRRCRPRSSSPAGGGSPYLFENLFWFFGHPEVYVLALPGFGILLELLPVFTRKPLWGYRLAVAGMLGVDAAELLRLAAPPVRQRHQLRRCGPFYMLSTELISIPTGLHLPVRDGDAVEGATIRYTVPMLFCLAWFFNFFIGGVSGVFLSDTPERRRHPRQLLRHGPLPLHDHGRADLHLLRGDLLLGAEDDRVAVQRATGEDPLLDRCSSPSTRPSCPLFAARAAWGCRGGSSTYASSLQPLNIWVSVSAFVPRRLDAGLPRQRRLLAGLRRASRREPNPWDSKSLEWQLPTPVPVHNFDRSR